MNISKKIFGILLALVMLAGYANVFAEESDVVISDAQIISGKTGEVTVSLRGTKNISSFYLYNLAYDKEAFILEDICLLVSDAAISDCDKSTGEIVFAFGENKELNGDIAKLTFRSAGKKVTSSVSYDIKAKYINDGEEVFTKDMTLAAGKIQTVSEFPKTMRLEDAESLYNGKAQSLKVKNLPTGAAVSYKVDGEEGKEAKDAGEYRITALVTKEGYFSKELTATLKILPAPLDIRGLTAKDKVYDGTKNADIDISQAKLEGILGEDEVYVDYPETGIFDSENVNTRGIWVSVEKPGLKGENSANYTLNDIPYLKAKITKASQEITVSDFPEKTYGDEEFLVSASASSGLPVTYKSLNEDIAEVDENGNIKIVGAGKTTIKITQAGNGNYLGATKEKELVIRPKTVVITDINIEEESITPEISECGILEEDLEKVTFDFGRVSSFVDTERDKVIYKNFFFAGEKGENYKVSVPGEQIEKDIVKEEAELNVSSGVTATANKVAGTDTVIVENISLEEISPEAEVITIDMEGIENGTVASVALPGTLFDEAEDRNISVKLTESEVTFDSEAVLAISERVGEETQKVTVTVREADDAELEEAQVTAKERFKNSRVFRLTIDGVSPAEDGRISFGEGKAKVVLEYRAPSGAKVKVKHLKDDGTTEAVSASYNKSAGTVTMSLSHFSEYMVYAEKNESSGGGGGGGGAPMEYTVEFNTNGGKEISKVKVSSGTVINLDNYISEKDGYEFAGWFLDSELKKIVSEVKVEANTTLYAKWKKIYATQIVLTIGKEDAVLNGNEIKCDAAPEIVNGRTMLPIRFIAEALGAKVSWDDSTRMVTIEKDKTTITLTIGKDTAFIDQKEVKLETSPYIKNDRTFLPVRFITENLGCEVLWDDINGEVTVRK